MNEKINLLVEKTEKNMSIRERNLRNGRTSRKPEKSRISLPNIPSVSIQSSNPGPKSSVGIILLPHRHDVGDPYLVIIQFFLRYSVNYKTNSDVGAKIVPNYYLSIIMNLIILHPLGTATVYASPKTT